MNIKTKFKNKKIALVLSGGVIKAGAWHLGVAKALQDLGFSFKKITKPKDNLRISTFVGSSAGAFVSVLLAAGYSPKEILNSVIGKESTPLSTLKYKDILFLKKHMKNEKIVQNQFIFEGFPYIVQQILKPISKISGFFSTDGLRKYLEDAIYPRKSFSDFDPDVFIVASKLDFSQKTVFSKKEFLSHEYDSITEYQTGVDICKAAAASMSVPPFYLPYPIEHPVNNETTYYIDGEIRDTLSGHIALENDCDLVISSWTHTPYKLQENVGSLINHGIPAICLQSIYLMIEKKIISAKSHIKMSQDIMNEVADYLKSQGIDLKHTEHIQGILEKKLNYKSNTSFIDIFPEPDDSELFFSNHFSLNPKVSNHIVKRAYSKTMNTFNSLKL